MKTVFTPKIIFTTLLVLGMAQFSLAQDADKGFSFQGYARDISGAALGGKTIEVKFSIYPQGGSNVFSEEQTLETDQYGLFSAVIGAEMTDDFEAIDFSAEKYFLKVETRELGGVYFEVNNAELLAVPYAKAANYSQKSDTAEVARNVLVGGVPTGTILPFGGPVGKVPTGYLPCDGRSVSVADYPDLHDAIDDSWGGDGGANFNLPDLRGRFMRGFDNGAGNDPDAASRALSNAGGNTGDAVGTLQADEFKQHRHNLSHAAENDENQGFPSQGFVGVWSTDRNVALGDGAMESVGGNETRPKNVTVLYIIKY